jgi:hypothetical protein
LVGKANKLDTRPRYGTFDKAYGMNIKEHKWENTWELWEQHKEPFAKHNKTPKP